MVGKNNHIRTIKSNLKEHYKSYKAGTRWIYASLASLALGAGLLLGGSMTTYADTASTNSQGSNVTVANNSSNAAVAAQTSSTRPLKSGASTTSAQTDVTNENGQAASSSNESATTAKTDVSNDTTTPNKQNAKTVTQNTTAAASDSANEAATNSGKPTQTTTPATTQSVSPKKLINPTEEQLDAAKTSADQAYVTTHQPQKIEAVSGEPATASTGSLTISTNAIGSGTNAKDPITLTWKMSAKAGDVAQVTVPADTLEYTFDSVDPLTGTQGTTVTTVNADGSRTITDTFASTVSTTQLIQLNLGSIISRPAGLADVGKKVTKTITFSITSNNQTVQEPSVSFTQLIQPTTDLSTVSMLHPNPDTVKALLPNQNYVFQVSVNEADGVQGDDQSVPRVNSVDNFGGSQITIPVPAGFILDTDNTSKINGITDGTTITQPGGKGKDVIIEVPALAGNRLEDQQRGKIEPYKIVGAFDVAQTAANQTLTANGDVTFSQKINPDDTITDKADPWSVTIIANNGGSDVGKSAAETIANGNSSMNANQLVLDTGTSDVPDYLNSFGFALDTASEANNTKIKIDIPNGLDVTSIQTPAQGVTPSAYLPDTTSYNYTLTLKDGTTKAGTVTAGGEVTVDDNAGIESAEFVPNAMAPGSYSDGSNPATSFIAKGHLATKYNDGQTPVKIGDQVTSSISVSFDGTDENNNQGTVSSSKSFTQTVVEAKALGLTYLVQRTNSTSPGNPSAGTLQIRYVDNGMGQTTDKVYEPTFYFVIPKVTTVASINSLSGYYDDPVTNAKYVKDPTGEELTKVTGAKVSQFTADNGQTVVKIDYAGTGTTVDLSKTTGYWGAVTLANNPDALPGNYPYYVYVASSTTKLLNNTAPVDASFVENNPNAYAMAIDNGDGHLPSTRDWKISTASSFFNTSLAQGNTDTSGAVETGTSDVKGSPDMTFYDSIVYTSPEDKATDHNATAVINLPTIGDAKNSQYTFDLTGAITVPTHYTTSTGDGAVINPVVLYSTTQQQFTDSNATSPDTTGYVPADQVSDWSAIRSIIVQVAGIQPNTSTGRIAIKGKVADVKDSDGNIVTTFNQMAGKTGYLQTAFYGDGAKVNVNSTDASVKLVDIPTNVSTQVEFVDDANNGAVVGSPIAISGVSGGTTNWDVSTVSLPSGYTLVKGQKTSGTYKFKASDNTPVLIHLTHVLDYRTKITTRTITYVVDDSNYTGQVPETQTQTITWKITSDEATGTSFATPTGVYSAETVPTIDGYTTKDTVAQKVYNGMATSNIPAANKDDVTVAYTPNEAQATVEYVDDDNNDVVVGTPTVLTGQTSGKADWNTNDKPTGYKLADGQAASGTYHFLNESNPVVKIHLTHILDYSNQTTTRTITYVVDDPNYTGQVPETQTQTITWKITSDEATGTSFATPTGVYSAETVPTIDGYTTKDTVAQKVYNGMATSNIPAANKDDVTVTYTPNDVKATVEYVDDDNNGAVVGTPTTITGKTSGTADWNTNDKPTGYKLAKGQAASGTYHFLNESDPVVKIHLTHSIVSVNVTTTRTITYTGVAKGQNPAAKVQPITWTINTDEVTGDTTYTPSGNYYEVDTPRVAGYTPDKTTVPAGVNAVTTTKPADANVTVTFKADPQSTTVEYVDDANDGAVVGTPTKLEGVTDGTASWNTDNKPAKYTLATGQAANGTYTFKAGDNAPVQIHLTHTMAYTTTTTTRTIHYVVNDPNYTGEVPAPTVQKVTWNVVTDEVTGRSVATPTAAYYEQTAPALAGYTAKPDKVAQQALGSVAAQNVPMYNEDVVVTYTPTSQPTKPGLTTEPSVPSDGTGVPENQPGGNPTGTPTEPTTPGTPAPGTATSGKTNGDDSQSSTESGSNAGTAEGLKTSAAAGAGSTTGTTAKAESQNGSVSQTRSNASATNQQQGSQAQHKLPQTNEQSQATVGLGVLGLLTSMLGLVGLKRRKRDDE